MNTAYVYLQLYKLFDNCTPIDVDCGKLCNKACCEGDDAGMYLFPGEEQVYNLLNPSWISVKKSNFTYKYNNCKKNVKIAMCDGNCDRYQRPLACRIFPLTPILDENNKIKVIIDPRAKGICPMAKAMKKKEFNEDFCKNIENSFKLLMNNKEFREFMKEYTKYIKDFLKFF